jgi:hypothetical protein
MNLMLNGIEAMKETGGVLTVNSQLAENGQIQISVHNSEPGLPLGNADQAVTVDVRDVPLRLANGPRRNKPSPNAE